jgi:2'-5' RNA ligase
MNAGITDEPATDGPSRPSERLFAAVALPDGVRSDVARLAEPAPGLSWTRLDQLHLTLRFIGDVGPGAAERIEERLGAVRVEAFIIPVEGVGSFPPGAPPRVLWVGVGRGHPHLFQLRQRLDDAILAAGIDLEVRHFQPHITVARCSPGGVPAATSWLRRHREYSSASFRVSAFDLCSSRLQPHGAVHALLRRYPLAQA